MRGNRLIGSRVLTAKLMCLASQTGCDALFLWEETFIDSQAQFATMGPCRKQSQGFSVDLCFPEAHILSFPTPASPQCGLFFVRAPCVLKFASARTLGLSVLSNEFSVKITEVPTPCR